MWTTATVPELAEMLARQGIEVDDGELLDELLGAAFTAFIEDASSGMRRPITGRLLGWDRDRQGGVRRRLAIDTASGPQSVLPEDLADLTATVELDGLAERIRSQRERTRSELDANAAYGALPCSAVRFAELARALGQAARDAGLTVPVFRSPSPGRNRSLRRHADGTTTLLITTRERSIDDVAFDLVEGVLAANRQGNDERLFRILIMAVRGDAAVARAIARQSTA